MTTDAWSIGYRGFWMGKSQHMNPYTRGQPEYGQWEQGWKDGLCDYN